MPEHALVHSLADAREKLNARCRHYNEVRPHCTFNAPGCPALARWRRQPVVVKKAAKFHLPAIQGWGAVQSHVGSGFSWMSVVGQGKDMRLEHPCLVAVAKIPILSDKPPWHEAVELTPRRAAAVLMSHFERILRMRTLLSVPALGFLAACGGGSDGSATNPIQSTPTVLNTFNDGSGVAYVTNSDGTLTATIISPDVNNLQSADAPVAFDFAGLSFDGSNQYGDFYSGETTINGTPVYIEYFQDANGPVAIAYAESGGENFLMALGEKALNMPSGTYDYYGTNIIGLRNGSFAENGTFAMTVNFDTGQAAVTGQTPLSTVGGSLAVNTSAGTFQGSNLTLGFDGTNYSGSMYGNFHGGGAAGVTGIYHDNGGDPLFTGAIAGTR